MKKRILGSAGVEVSAIGLGCWGMSGAYGEGSREESIATIHEAVDYGIDFIDTADVYGDGHNEELVNEALKGRRNRVFLASKFGFVYDENGDLDVDGSPGYVQKACEASLKRLGTDHIDLYYLHRVDKNVPIEETVGAMARLVEQGKVRFLGLSEASGKTLDRAEKVHPIAAMQSEYSLNSRDVEEEVIPSCRKNNTAFVAFSPLGRALLTGSIKKKEDMAEDDFRRNLPRFQGDNFKRNLKLIAIIEEIAAKKSVKPSQLALAWLLHQGDDVIPIPGMKRRKYIRENAGAVDVHITEDEMKALNSLYDNIAGERYTESSRRFID
ncbi:MAG: aldo/keto reductase [Bacteroidales bacterium]